MSSNPKFRLSLLAVLGLYFSVFAHAAPGGACQVAQPPEKVEPGQHQHQEHHHLHLPMGEEKCEPTSTYSDGALGPSHVTDTFSVFCN